MTSAGWLFMAVIWSVISITIFISLKKIVGNK